MTFFGKIFLVTAGLIGLAVNFASLIHVSACQGEMIARSISEQTGNCAEFWLNRYQTLIGVVGAGLIGWMAVAPVWRQVRFMSAQVALDMQPHIIARRDINSRNIKLLNDVFDFFREGAWFAEGAEAQKTAVDFDKKMTAEMKKIVEKFEVLRLRDWDGFTEQLGLLSHEREARWKFRISFDKARWTAGRMYRQAEDPLDIKPTIINGESVLVFISDHMTKNLAPCGQLLRSLTHEAMALSKKGENIRQVIDDVL